MSAFYRQRCFNHAAREAVARCRSCENDYCRECVSEHDGQYLCAACIAERAKADDRPVRQIPFLGFASFILGVLVLWVVFFSYAQLVFAIPDEFHFHQQYHDDVWRSGGSEYYEGEGYCECEGEGESLSGYVGDMEEGA